MINLKVILSDSDGNTILKLSFDGKTIDDCLNNTKKWLNEQGVKGLPWEK